MTDRDPKLTQIYVDLPHHQGADGEAIWALPLGDDTFELRNVPFYAYGLNFRDVVHAVAPGADKPPEIVSVVKRSGHATLRVFLDDAAPADARASLFAAFERFRAVSEKATASYLAVDVAPDGDMAGLRAELDRWEEQGVLFYETCEARVPGSFDDEPGAGQIEA